MGEARAKTDRDEPDRLVAWSLGAFHAATLVGVLVALGHTAGVLGGLLADLNTLAGLALYILLWLLSWRATRAVLSRVPPATIETGATGEAIAWGAVGGAGTGVVFLIGIVLVAVAPVILRGGDVLSVGFILLVGGIAAATVGAVVGGLFAVLDIAFFRLAARVGGPSPE